MNLFRGSLFLVLLLCLVLYLPAGPGKAASAGAAARPTLTPTSTPDAALLAAGLKVYRAQYCGVCHTLAAAGTKGSFGPVHDGMRETARRRVRDPGYTGDAATAADYLRESLLDPSAYIVPGYSATSHRMPTYAHLEANELRALVAFLMSQ